MQILFGVIFILISAIFLFIFLITRKNEKVIDSMPMTTGVIQARKMVSDGPDNIYEIEILCSNGEKKIFDTQSCRNKNGVAITPGTVVNIKLIEKKVLGFDTYDIRIVDERYVKLGFHKSYIVFAIISIALFLGGIVIMFI